MDKNLGGRGKKAPYETTHVRVPVPIKDRVENLKELYVSGLIEQYDNDIEENARLANEYRNLLKEKNTQQLSEDNKPVALENALLEAKNILKSKQSARKSIVKLLTALYGIQFSEDDFKE